MQAKRIKWKELKLAIEHWRLVFLDESGVNIGMTRRYGRAIGKARVHGSAPLNVPTSQTVLASVRLNGQITYTMYPGGTSGERFLDYLKNVLIPTLHKGDIVVMDNMRSHHVKGVEEVLRAAGMIPLYLPPYSPDLNPIEMLLVEDEGYFTEAGLQHCCTFAPDGRRGTCSRFAGGLFRLVYC